MDKYAHRLHDWLESGEFGLNVRLAAHIGALTRESSGRRGSAKKERGDRRKSFVRWWTQPLDPSRVVLPGPLHGPQQWAARYYFYPWRVKREAKRADLVHVLDHSYAHMIEKAGRRPVVVTVHDLMPVVVLRSPTEGWREGWREGMRARFLRQALKSLRQADAYIVGTDWLKRELATWLGNDKNIHVVPFGVDRAFFSESTTGGRERWRRDWRIPEDAFVVLHVGSTVDRKNLPLVIQTVARLRQETDAYLLQVGGRFTSEQEQLIDRLDLRRYVRSVAAADETTLRRAYRVADVLLFPSLYEGVGFPVLEAFASGLPVVTSGAGGLKEVGGDAAIVVEGRDPAAYVQALERLGEDSDEREELIEKGWARARQFTWQKTAAMTAEVYKPLF
jgi:glycosyltransferase involved in cell wall biosynthesis